MDFLIVTGMSGAGKTVAVNELEDMGYFCVDNIPASLITQFAALCSRSPMTGKIALVTDFRSKTLLDSFVPELEGLQAQGHSYRILLLEADNQVILHRYKENRRRHPMLEEGCNSLEAAIERERTMLAEICGMADFRIDTSLLTVAQLRGRIEALFGCEEEGGKLTITCMSFGYKYGIPAEVDLVFDVRCLPNPFYVPALKEHTGLEKAVQDYVLHTPQAQGMLERLQQLISYLLPLYIQEGKCNLVIGFGCTGGKHRSVTFAETMYHALLADGYRVHVSHRDIQRTR